MCPLFGLYYSLGIDGKWSGYFSTFLWSYTFVVPIYNLFIIVSSFHYCGNTNIFRVYSATFLLRLIFLETLDPLYQETQKYISRNFEI